MVTLAVILMIFIPLQDLVKDIISANDTSPFEFSLFLNEKVPAESVIETFESELVFLTDRKFHQPSLQELNAAIRYVQFSEPYPKDLYNLREFDPDYLVDGGFSKSTNFYSEELKSGDAKSIGVVRSGVTSVEKSNKSDKSGRVLLKMSPKRSASVPLNEPFNTDFCKRTAQEDALISMFTCMPWPCFFFGTFVT